MGGTRLKNMHFKDLNPILTGFEQCPPNFVNENKIMKETVIHYVEKGKGYFIINNTRYDVRSEQIFIIPPGVECSYYTGEDDPWFYRYVNFNGELSKDFLSLPPVMNFDYGEIFREISDIQNYLGEREYLIAGLLFKLYAKIFAKERYVKNYVREIMLYIRDNYYKKITVHDIAQKYNYHPNYLTTAFKNHTGMSIQAYLTSVRMEFAAQKLENGESVSEASVHCGYNDIANFSKAFKNQYGISPMKWKKQVALKK